MSNIIDYDNYKFSIDLKYEVNNYFTIEIKIKSGDFSGKNNFCISKIEIEEYIQKLYDMDNKLEGKCVINDFDSDSLIKIEFEKYGHLNINGLLGGTHSDQYLKFEFTTDQTILKKLISEFKLILLK